MICPACENNKIRTVGWRGLSILFKCITRGQVFLDDGLPSFEADLAQAALRGSNVSTL